MRVKVTLLTFSLPNHHCKSYTFLRIFNQNACMYKQKSKGNNIYISLSVIIAEIKHVFMHMRSVNKSKELSLLFNRPLY